MDEDGHWAAKPFLCTDAEGKVIGRTEDKVPDKQGICKDCKCFQDIGKQTGECRKYAPKTIIAGCGIGEVPEYSNDWAIVKTYDWCGEFEAKE